MSNLRHFLKSILRFDTDKFSSFRTSPKKFQTFTIFIPAPKQDKVSYREKEFDQITYNLLNKGFEIIEIKTQTIVGEKTSGMWVIFLLKSLNEESSKLNLDEEYKAENTPNKIMLQPGEFDSEITLDFETSN